MKRGFLILFLCVFFSSFVSASLGLSPAGQKFDFTPNKEIIIDYTVISDSPEKEIELYVEGDLKEYVKLSKDKIKGPGNFMATINLPDKIEKPGEHKIIIGAREIPGEDQFLGTAINIRVVVKVFVPYPGRYIESTLNIPDGNINEEIPVELHVINRGKEDYEVSVNIDFYDGSGEKVYTMPFQPVFLETLKDRYFRKFLDSADYKPGNYLAEAVIDYGETSKVNKSFRIGSLFVNVTNFTESLPKEGIQKFLIGVESLWNDDLDEVYADVNVSNDVQSVFFRTPSVDLNAWEQKNLEGFIDTSDLEGEYEVYVELIYAGKKTIASGNLKIKEFNLMLVVVISLALLILIAIVFIKFYLFRKAKKK